MFLVFDTSINACSVGVFDNSLKTLSSVVKQMKRGQAEHLISFIDEKIKEAKINFKDLSFVGTTVGPGSFTGVRTGLSTAKSLGLSLKIPVYGVLTTQAFAFEAINNKTPILTVLETKRRDFYYQLFDKNANCLTSALAGTENEIIEKIKQTQKNFILVGDATNRFLSLIKKDDEKLFESKIYIEFFNPKSIAQIALKQHKNEIEKQKVSPVYLRAPDVNLKS